PRWRVGLMPFSKRISSPKICSHYCTSSIKRGPLNDPPKHCKGTKSWQEVERSGNSFTRRLLVFQCESWHCRARDRLRLLWLPVRSGVPREAGCHHGNIAWYRVESLGYC